jgi:diadenylate cyclase
MSALPEGGRFGGKKNMVSDLIHTFRWQDGLDILILTFILYRLFLRLRNKRALRMILPILALPFFYALAQWIDLPLSVWGLQNLWAVILLVLVVIFQQEIREVLGSLTLPTLFFGKPELLASDVFEEIAEASFRMAGQGIGGLIVLQQNDDLDEFIHGQMALDAKVKAEMLISIFNPQSPLHDGAVVIHRDRIRYAGALLPVSQSSFFPKGWGTRHRAGMGITEVSDAECIIISEERREVLFGSRGKAGKKEGKEDLKQAVFQSPLRSKEKESKTRWPGLLIDHLPVKVLFLCLVFVLWIFVIGFHQGETSYNIALEYYSVPSDLELAGDPPKEINIRLRGSQRLLSSVKPEHIRVHIDLSKGHRGLNFIKVTEKEIDTPSGTTLTRLYPRDLRVQLSPLSNGIRKP